MNYDLGISRRAADVAFASKDLVTSQKP